VIAAPLRRGATPEFLAALAREGSATPRTLLQPTTRRLP
jgi:hypothetical protein